MTREEKIIGFLRSPGYVPMGAQALAAAMEVPEADLPLFAELLETLLAQKKILINKKGKLKAASAHTLTGKFKALRTGGFVDALDASTSVFVPLCETRGAIEGDIVTCIVQPQKQRDGKNKPEGKIERILRHTLTHVVGTLVQYGQAYYVEPDDSALSFAVRIRDRKGAHAGDKVVAFLERYPGQTTYADGTITSLLGKDGDIDTELAAISHKAGLQTEFDAKALAQAQAAAAQPVTSKGRTDFRQKCVITIDGDDSKDFDDAVCVEKNADGYILYVHIADVTHYVSAGSALDRAAAKRGTSVYYPGSVLPMLPEALSNGICSLNPHEDRYTLSVTMHIGNDGTVTDYKIENGIIRSAYRMTYRNVTALLEGTDAALAAQYEALLPMLKTMQALALLLENQRRARGSVDFDLPEPHIVLDEGGKPCAVTTSEIGISNKIIESFMLLANETVARHAAKAAQPFVYRVHEAPSADKLEALNSFLGYIGLPAMPQGTPQPQHFAALMRTAQTHENTALICTFALRAMMKARYDAENLGHFGLAATDYCHFTSPIRRYPDLFIHRVLKLQLAGARNEATSAQLAEAAKATAVAASEAELAAVEAEREADKLFICMYMEQFVGEQFDAVVAAITDFGIFVTVNGAIDGLVPLSALDDDYYIYDAAHYCLRGERTGKIYALGDTLRVRLVQASAKARKLDFAPVGAGVRTKKPYAQALQTKKKKASAKKQTGKFVRKKQRRQHK